MNGDEKEEAHRPRPLSAGIWTLFSWLRRSERSSSSESVSSIGSARTAVSFDFLTPGNCNFTNTPIVLTASLNPPTETYKKRLQDRNLRRQRDRDVTLHRKYGLFREYGNGYDGFSLPPARRTLWNSVEKPNRERRATSECLQRRAAYVPGKRRAPLPPALATSSSLPRTYKRKRPAPKPPIKSTIKDNNNIVPLIDNSVRMTSNSEPETKFLPDSELLNNNSNQKYDKKVTTSKDTKSKMDKSFLKHIFENKKRSSVIETSSVRLLPSISELDKQATEIIENNKLRQKINNVNREGGNNLQDSTAIYEGNSWFCTSCLRKYNSSVDSCNYCIPADKRHLLQKDDLRMLSPRSSIYTQTNINVETETSNRNSIDERKMLKEILKEMKDSLPKKNKNNKINNVLTESPTLRIGSTVQEIYKDLTSQPSSSSENVGSNNRIFPTSSLLSETQQNCDPQNNAHQYVLSGAVSSDMKNVKEYKVITAFDNETNIERSSASLQKHSSSAKDEQRDKKYNANHLPLFLSNKKSPQETNITKVTDDKSHDNTNIKDSVNIKNTGHTQSLLPLLSTKSNDSKENNKNNLKISHDTSSNILLGHQIYKNHIGNRQNQDSSTSGANYVSTASDKIQSKPSKLQFLNFPSSHAVVVNNVTVVTTQSNNKSSEKLKDLSIKNTDNNSMQASTPKEQNGSKVKGIQLLCDVSVKNTKTTNNETYLETKTDLVKSSETSIDNVKSGYNLHTPLNISSLLNPLYNPNETIVKENISTKTHGSKPSAPKTIDMDKVDTKVNKKVLDKITPFYSDLKTQIKETVKIEPQAKMVPQKDGLYEQKAVPSTSGCSGKVQSSNNNMNKLDDYDRRRQLINQLEQSIAKGDEVAAAEAAVKLAKLRLSCSVLSFSSQIVSDASNSNTKHNEKYSQHNLLDINTISAKDEPLQQAIPQGQTAEIVEQKKQTPVNKLLENKRESNKDSTNSGNESKEKKQLSTNEPSSSNQVILEDEVPINVWIEDKQAARGPIRLNISRRATVADLRRQAQHSLGLATQLQRWIVGRTLCSDDATSIISLAGPNVTAPFYLCIVQPDQNDKIVTNEAINNSKNNTTGQSGEFYTELMNLEKQSLVPNVEPFECSVCMEECAAGAGVILRECIHTFCRECLSDVVQHSQEPVVACPAMGCSGFLQEREIRTIVTPEEYERWLARGLATAECGTRNAFHCRTRDCTGWAFCDPGVRRFPCPVCKNINCVQCQAIHEGETCDQYQTKLRQAVTAAATNKDDEGTQALLNSLISKGEALECPECRAIITKKWGCDWVKCSACKTEICWVTKGRRWGPGGRGDTSGGCRCGVDGQRCHPSCGYCH